MGDEEENTVVRKPGFFEEEWWEQYWQDMPEFVQDNKGPWKSAIVHF